MGRAIVNAIHGGDVRGIARARGALVADFIDFSANINPLGPPDGVRELVRHYARDGWLMHYPEPGLPELAAVVARLRGVTPQQILIHCGSAALFDVILRACAPRRLGICIPAFAEYARAADANQIGVRTFALDAGNDIAFDAERFCARVRRDSIDAVILTNPHNPLGYALASALIRDLRARLPMTTFIIDEAFADYDEAGSVAREAAVDAKLIVVRSVTKFYAIPDLRVGYAVMTHELARAMSRYIPAWPVSGIAAAAAAVAVADEGYAVRARANNIRERARLAAGLLALGFRVLPSSANFVTFAIPNASSVRERLLAQHGIIVRDCSSFAGLDPDTYLRVAVRSASDNARLIEALTALR